MTIYFSEDPDDETKKIMYKAAELCVKKEGLDPAAFELSVSFEDESRMRELNRVYRGLDEVTDVLSFLQFESVDDLRGLAIAELGDVVICRERAAVQAEEYGHSYERELIYLFVHSVLHLLGYDHMKEDEKAAMRKREEEIMDILGIGQDKA